MRALARSVAAKSRTGKRLNDTKFCHPNWLASNPEGLAPVGSQRYSGSPAWSQGKPLQSFLHLEIAVITGLFFLMPGVYGQ